MKLEHPEQKGVKVFHSVAKRWNSINYVFHFIPANEQMAIMIVKGLIPYLKFVYGDWVEIFLNGEAVMAKADWYWDEDKCSVISPTSRQLDLIIDQYKDFVFEVPEGLKEGSGVVENTPPTKLSAPMLYLQNIMLGQDSDLVSTWRPASAQKTALMSPSRESTKDSSTKHSDSQISSRFTPSDSGSVGTAGTYQIQNIYDGNGVNVNENRIFLDARGATSSNTSNNG